MTTKTKSGPRKAAAAEPTSRYFIVNPKGTIHECDADHAKWRLGQIGYRQATLEEVRELMARGGNQRFDDPICDPWSPEPAPLIGLEALDLQEEG